MNKIVILCGADSSGKTTTLRGFFGVTKGKSPSHFKGRKIDGRIVCAVSFCSPQEQEDFCVVKDVQRNIQKRIEECVKETNGKSYILIIPFTMSVSEKDRTRLNEDCIRKPIEELKKSFKVFIIYLRKETAQKLREKDALMDCIIFDKKIETTKKDYDKSTELEDFLKSNKRKSRNNFSNF